MTQEQFEKARVLTEERATLIGHMKSIVGKRGLIDNSPGVTIGGRISLEGKYLPKGSINDLLEQYLFILRRKIDKIEKAIEAI